MTLSSDALARGSGPGHDASPARSPLVVAGAVVAIAAGLVLFFVTTSDLWLDEALSVNIARLPLSDIPDWLRHDGAPPLYYLLLHVWTGVLGDGDLASRSLSGVAAIGAAVLAYFAGRRLSGPFTGWAALLLFVSNPFAIRYATEARMYMLFILLILAAYLVIARALERPDLGRLALVALFVALLLYTQYWSLYLGVVAGAALLWMAWKGPNRDAARRVLVAFVVGGLTFVFWLPNFLYQAQHTGTPWGEPQLPPLGIGQSLSDFAGGTNHEGWMLLFPAIALLLLAVFGSAVDRFHIAIDLRTHAPGRWLALFLAAALAVGLSLNYLSGGAFQTRYAAFVFPFWLLLVAHGFNCFADRGIRIGVLAVMVALGLVGGVRNAVTNRSQTGEVAAALRDQAKPGDVVVYCPDQLGPATERNAPHDLVVFAYPTSRDPGTLVDWVDYEDAIAATPPDDFAGEVLAAAGDRTIWLVTSPGYRTHSAQCNDISVALGPDRLVEQIVSPDENIFEKAGLRRFAVP